MECVVEGVNVMPSSVKIESSGESTSGVLFPVGFEVDDGASKNLIQCPSIPWRM